jgi:alginate O-acetyltransferase complex protein AlgI
MFLDTMADISRKLLSTEFNFFSDFSFWFFFIPVVLGFHLVRNSGAGKNLFLLLANSLMLLALPRFNVAALSLYAMVAGFAYAIGKSIRSEKLAGKPQLRVILATAGIIGIIFALAVFKYRAIQSAILLQIPSLSTGASGFIFLIGISYASFRAIHFIIESYKGTIKQASFLSFFNYLVFFPAFVSGPIHRYGEFLEHSAANGFGFRSHMGPALERIVAGLFKKFVITVLLFPYAIVNVKTPLAALAWWQVLGGLYIYALYFYFDFSGYTDLAIGSARLLGFKLPENFNQPFLKKNLQQLWANWHMSLTSWLTDYVYWPLVRKMRSMENLRKYPLVISNIAILITFFLCGAWHGETINFIIWGLYHGFGIVLVNLYQKWKRQMRHPMVLKYFSSQLSYWLGVFLSFNFFAIGLLFLLTSEQRANIFNGLFRG